MVAARRFLVLMGPPGAGKGTQAARLAADAGLCQLSTGDLLRAALNAGTPAGTAAERTMAAGELVADPVILDLVAEALDAPGCAGGAVFDGFPRTIPQAEGLAALLAARQGAVERVLVLEVPDAEIVSRLSGRRVCKTCGKLYHISFGPSRKEGVCDACGGALVQRPDDLPDTVVRRLAVYREQTAPVRAFYAARGDVTVVPGDRSKDEVAEAVREAVRAVGPRAAW